jgi:hypothetical protein
MRPTSNQSPICPISAFLSQVSDVVSERAISKSARRQGRTNRRPILRVPEICRGQRRELRYSNQSPPAPRTCQAAAATSSSGRPAAQAILALVTLDYGLQRSLLALGALPNQLAPDLGDARTLPARKEAGNGLPKVCIDFNAEILRGVVDLAALSGNEGFKSCSGLRMNVPRGGGRSGAVQPKPAPQSAET